MEDYDGSETTELSMLQIIHDPATLASPDLLSEVSEMKQDLIKVSVLLSSEKLEKSYSSGPGERLDKPGDEEVDEPFEIVEKVKEELEKVEEILRDRTMDDTKREGAIGRSVTIDDEEWVLLSETDVEESKSKNITEVQEALIPEVRLTRVTISSSPPKKDMSGMISYLSSDLEYCLQETPVPSNDSQDVDSVQESFKEVVVTRGKHRPVEIKKPARKRRKEREFASGSSEDDLERMSRSQSEESLDEDAVIGGSEPVFGPVPVSPRVVETPIGSIKDKVKALQKKVEEENEVDSQKWKSQTVSTSQSKPYVTETETSAKLPPRSPKSQTERLEETMSVRELMKAFQTGQDPSKSKSGLFEHKAITTVTSEMPSPDVVQIPSTYDSQMTVTTQHLQKRTITTVTSEMPSPDVVQIPSTYDGQMTATTQHSQERAITTIASEESSDVMQVMFEMPSSNVVQIPQTYDGQMTATTQHLQERAITTIASEASSDVMQVTPTYNNQITESTQHLQEKIVMEDKILQESSHIDQNTIQHKSMSSDGEAVHEKTLTIIQIEGDQAITSNIIFNFEDKSSPEDLLGKHTANDQNGKPYQEPETEAQQIWSELLRNKDPRLIRERMYYEDNICQNRRLSVEPQISPDRKSSEDFSADIKAELEENSEYLLFRRTSGEVSKHYLMCSDGLSLEDEEQIHQAAVDPSKSNIITAFATAMVQGEPLSQSEIQDGALEKSPNIDKHEALADSPGNTIGTRTPHSSTGESEKHEGLAETPQNSPEVLVFSSSTTSKETEDRYPGDQETTHQSSSASHERAESDKSELCSATSIKSKTESPYDPKIESSSPYTSIESPSSTNSKTIVQNIIQVMKLESEILAHDMKSDLICEDSMKLMKSVVITESEKIPQHSHHSQDAPERPSSLDSLQPATMSDTKTLYRTDSLETTPIREDGSSQKSPDSIEPSPTKEFPCQDSLEGSPTGQESVSYTENVFSTSQAFISDSGEKELISKQNVYLECESSQGFHDTLDMQCISMTLEKKEKVIDSEELHDFDALQRQFTPDEEMFKMAAKIKTFDEMEKDAKVKKVKFDFDCGSKQPKEEEVLSPHKGSLDFNTMLTITSEEQYSENPAESSPVLPLHSSLSDDYYDSPELDKSTEWFLSGETTDVLETTDKMEEEQTHLKIVDLQTCIDIPSMQTYVENKEEDYEQLPSEYHRIVIGETTTNEDIIITSAESKMGIEKDGDVNSKSTGERTTSEKVLEPVSPIDNVCATTVTKEVQDESQPDCIYQEDIEGKPEEIPVSIPRDLVPWSADVEGDEAFDAKIEAEEQKILALCIDRRSHGTTPDTTPGRTPTEEGTPNPFLFQEGKLFEMTRGGAIDMTKRTMEEEEERLVFFPINEDSGEEFEQVNFSASESVAVASFEMPTDGLVHQDRITDEHDGFSKLEPKLFIQKIQNGIIFLSEVNQRVPQRIMESVKTH